MELGYDWKSYIDYLEHLDHLMGDVSAEISKTHPTSHERIDAIEKLVADQKFVTKPGKKNQKRFKTPPTTRYRARIFSKLYPPLN